MKKIGMILLALAMVFSVLISMIDSAGAGETVKVKATASNVTTKWHQIEIGDVEGHIIGVYENTQLWVDAQDGQKVIAHSRGIMDLNPQKGQGTLQGYGLYTYPDGDKRFSSYDGELVGKGQWKGKYTEIGGTGKYEGCTGGGTWESKSLGAGIGEVVAEGERTLK